MNSQLTEQASTINSLNIGKYVTFRINQQLFALPAFEVKDILPLPKITPIPLATPEIAGLFNLRGNIVTAIDLREKMGMETATAPVNYKSIVISYGNDLYSFLADEIDKIYDIPTSQIEHNPDNLSAKWQEYCLGIYKLEQELMVILNIEGLFQPQYK